MKTEITETALTAILQQETAELQSKLRWAKRVLDGAGARSDRDPTALVCAAVALSDMMHAFEAQMDGYGFTTPQIAAAIVRHFGSDYFNESFVNDLIHEGEQAAKWQAADLALKRNQVEAA